MAEFFIAIAATLGYLGMLFGGLTANLTYPAALSNPLLRELVQHST
jgi:hypothetical protein